jgi:flagellar biosynthesis component FlhA
VLISKYLKSLEKFATEQETEQEEAPASPAPSKSRQPKAHHEPPDIGTVISGLGLEECKLVLAAMERNFESEARALRRRFAKKREPVIDAIHIKMQMQGL